MKMLRKLKAGVLIFALLISTARLACVSAADGHLVPGTGSGTGKPEQNCNNTYRTYSHIGCD
ncbi:MAG: hypothetical protein K2O03_09980, partial [Lachnospiraceae bacterium]|nr:hypothetical protein [Lachnospiraceae bacterium]